MDESAGAQGRYEWLKGARNRADAKNPVEMTVRDLLTWWDARTDGTTAYQRVDADLANHGLTTSPGYRKVSADTIIRLITSAQDAEATGHAPADADDEDELVAFQAGHAGSIPVARSTGAAVALAQRDGRGAVPFPASSRRWISISSSRYR